MDADAIVVGAGLAGLVAACELVAAGRTVIVLDQEGEQSLGGQAHWSLGGLFLINSPEQRRAGVRDSRELALMDWMGTAAFDRAEDLWPRRWAEAYVDFAAGEKRPWLHERGVRFFPLVGWAERGGGVALGHGNSVPRFHIVWGSGPAVLEPFIRQALEAEAAGLLSFRFRHRVNAISRTGGAVDGVSGDILAPTDLPRGQKTSRDVLGAFSLTAGAVIVASGGIGANRDLVRQTWPERLGMPPDDMITGVPDYVDGRMLGIAEAAGGTIINRDRMWHYVEGIKNWSPIWTDHAVRILPGPSSIWLDAHGRRLPVPLFPGFDTLGTLRYLRTTGYDHSWAILTRKIIKKEFALSGSEQNPDLAAKSWPQILRRAIKGMPPPVQAFMDKGEDFIVERELPALVSRMNALIGKPLLELAQVEREIRGRDSQLDNPFGKDAQVAAIRGARSYIGDRILRAAKPHKLLDPEAGPLIAVRLRVMTRKTLGGLQTDLDGRVIGADGQPVPGLYACGEAAGFGGGGVHGYAALEGTFLGGCIFSGRQAGRAVAAGAA